MAICKVESKDYTKALELLNEAKLIDPGNEYIKIYSIILKLKENSNPQDFYDWGLEEFFQKTDTEIIIFLCQSAHFEKNKAVFFLFIDTALKCFEKASKYNQNDALMMIKLSRICLNDILNDENIK
ncbi:hypothetical protein K502DRAFT_356489 [Neoconidiobolus thromboides FSU 785]|nr:hypothetical protein K502DRAFT_356489 [Neoconidiobolus thromboides FSU 785]